MQSKSVVSDSLSFALGRCFLGTVLIAKSDKGLSAVFLGNTPDQLIKELYQQFPDMTINSDNKGMTRLLSDVIKFIEKPDQQSNFRLDVQGTDFQKQIWQELRQIPPGTTISYSQLAEQLGSPKAARAVANACAANKLAVLIPCHRVVRADGSLSGYRWGVDRKQKLLAKEARLNIKLA